MKVAPSCALKLLSDFLYVVEIDLFFGLSFGLSSQSAIGWCSCLALTHLREIRSEMDVAETRPGYHIWLGGGPCSEACFKVGIIWSAIRTAL